MSDVYKLQYNGMTLAYPGWNGYVSYESAPVTGYYLVTGATAQYVANSTTGTWSATGYAP